MDNHEENTQEFDLEDILKEFGSGQDPLTPPEPEEEVPAPETEPAEAEEAPAEEALPEEPAWDSAPEETEEPEADPIPEPEVEAAPSLSDTIRLDDLGEVAEEPQPQPEEAEPFSENWEPEYDQPMGEYIPPAPIPFRPRNRLRELKKKLVAGPERRYYELSEMGLGKLQLAIAVSLLVVVICGGATILYAAGMVAENRMRLLIFSQILGMLVSALLGCYCMMDGVAQLCKGRLTLNFMLLVALIACCVDAFFCLWELRVPCCAAYSLSVTMSLLSRYQARNTEMGQMDTLRKAVRLHSITKTDDYYEGRPGILRGEGEPEDFMETYSAVTGPEKAQSTYALVSLLACAAITVVAGVLHGVSLAVQILATSLLVAVPASFFIALTRPMDVLERRFHLVGTVLCGWQGVRGLCGDAAFPLNDEDIFPAGSTKLNGVKFYGDRNPDQAVAYASALITAGGGGLVSLFSQLLKSRSGIKYDVENFQNYPAGGIGGEVNGEPVLMGSLSFLQDMGVEIPEGTMVNQAVYCAIDGSLSAVFAISYARMKSSAAGLVSLCGYRKLTPVVTCGDFMVTESFLRSKFGINTRRMAFPPREIRAELAEREWDPEAPVLALTTQEGLSSAAYAVTGARALRTASKLGLAIHITAGVLGMLIMLVLAILGSAELLTPVNVLLYQLVWMIPGVLVTEWTRTV